MTGTQISYNTFHCNQVVKISLCCSRNGSFIRVGARLKILVKSLRQRTVAGCQLKGFFPLCVLLWPQRRRDHRNSVVDWCMNTLNQVPVWMCTFEITTLSLSLSHIIFMRSLMLLFQCIVTENYKELFSRNLKLCDLRFQ